MRSSLIQGVGAAVPLVAALDPDRHRWSIACNRVRLLIALALRLDARAPLLTAFAPSVADAVRRADADRRSARPAR